MGGAAAGGAGVTAFLQSLADYGMQQLTANRNKKEARRARAHQIYMRSTAYQATMKDMKEAGLNPILAYSQGATGAGSSPMASHSGGGTSAGAAFAGAHSAISAGKLRKEEQLNLAKQREVMDTQVGLNTNLTAQAEAKALLDANSAESVRIQNIKDKKFLPIHEGIGKGVSTSAKGIQEAVKRLNEDKSFMQRPESPTRRSHAPRGKR